MSLGSVAVEIRPTVLGTLILLAGRPKLGWFRKLKNSARNSNLSFSVSRVVLKRAVSQLKNPGPNSMLRAELPYVNGAGTAKASGLNQRAVDGLLTFGSPTILALLLGHPKTVLVNVTE